MQLGENQLSMTQHDFIKAGPGPRAQSPVLKITTAQVPDECQAVSVGASLPKAADETCHYKPSPEERLLEPNLFGAGCAPRLSKPGMNL